MAMPYPDQVNWAGEKLWSLVHQLTPEYRRKWADRFLPKQPLPDEADTPSQGPTES